MIETPTAVFNARVIAATARDSRRLCGLVLGTNDLAKETRAKILPGRAPMLPWLTTCLLAAREHGIDILDGVFNDIANAEGFADECAGARPRLRRQTLIHPTDRAVRGVLAQRRRGRAGAQDDRGVRLPENKEKGVVQIDGRMVERMHAEMARRTVAIAGRSRRA
jgi:citrate lyase subunit beta/citryl-CoA lyase